MSTQGLAMVVGLTLAGAAALRGEHPEHPKQAADKAEGSHALDKKVFSGMLDSDRDDLRFEKGTFTSAASKRMGFSAAPYAATEKDGVISFTASVKNASGETMEWTGTVTGDVLEATAVRGDRTYHYKGAAVKAKQEAEHPEHPEHPR